MELKENFLFILLVFLWEKVTGLDLYPGACPVMNPVEKFDLDKFLGVWYVQSHYPFDDEPQLECQHFLYQRHSGRYYEFELLLDNRVAKKVMTRSTVIRYVDSTGGIEVKRRNSTYDNPPHRKPIPTRPHRFTMFPVAVEYDSYVVMLTCIAHRKGHYLGAWIMTRHCKPPGKHILAAQNALIKQEIEVVDMMDAKQFDCDVYE
ncbi:insecticyanin-B-like [Drosophila guanche]|uniref:Blast:Insecticyanin-B n=1 Tax=Drosophila guanche TaxID=7266 RepID=A0A3B0JGW1_DROGU|nr:insecticyanin-B-like [Drosophila guanche]SPP79953.1 blast:Insecticyanin-B [Drosophila guanche]